MLLFKMCTYFSVAIVLVVGALCRKQHIERTQKLSNVTHILVHIVASNDSWSNSIEIVCFFSRLLLLFLFSFSSLFFFLFTFCALAHRHRRCRCRRRCFDEVCEICKFDTVDRREDRFLGIFPAKSKALVPSNKCAN